MDTRASLHIWVGDRTARMLVSAAERSQPLRLAFSQIPGKEREGLGGRVGASLAVAVGRSVFAFPCVWPAFHVCLFVPVCCHYLMAGRFCPCSQHLGFFCRSAFCYPFGKRLPSFASCPTPCFRSVGFRLSVGFCARPLVVCLLSPPVSPQNLGPSILAGVALMVLLIPLNGAVAMKMRAFQVRATMGLLLLPGAPGRLPGGRPFTNLEPLACLDH